MADDFPLITLLGTTGPWMNVRSYRDSDVEAVARLFTASVHALAEDHYDAAQRAAWAPCLPDLDDWKRRLGQLQTFVAEEDSRLAGFISYEQSGHIEFLYTSPAYARRGVASALYSQVESILASQGIAELFAEASVVARPFFEHWGFRVTEEQLVHRRGVAFRRYRMRKPLAAQQTRAADARKASRG